MINNTLTADQFIVRNRILGDLHSGVCTVIFTKVDGTERTMRCTLKQDLLPKQEAPKAYTANAAVTASAMLKDALDAAASGLNQPKESNITPTPTRKKSENNISVWDLEKEAWRSFNIASLIEWKQES